MIQNIRSVLISGIFILSLAFLLATLFSGCEKAGPVESLEGTATLTVLVWDANSKPLPNATVELYSGGIFQPSYRFGSPQSTGPDGKTTFYDIPARIGIERDWGIQVTYSNDSLTCSVNKYVKCISCNQFRDTVKFSSDNCRRKDYPICSRNVDNLTFGRVLVGTSRDTSFQITNMGTAPLVINEIRVENQRPPSSPPPDTVFRVTSPTSFPVTLNPGQSKIVMVKFAPQGDTTYTAQLVINTNATGQNSCGDVTLQGKGTTTAIIKCASLIRWDQINYFGWAFSDLPNVTGAVVADSVQSRTNPAHDPKPSPPNGTQLADFIYLGLKSATDTSQGGYILAANGAQVLTGAYQTFDAHVPISGYQSETALLVKAGNVVAIKTRSGRYAKIRIDVLFPDGATVKDEIQFCQIFPAIAP